MRRYHRWLAVFFAPLLLWIAGTGLAMHLAPLIERAVGVAPEAPVASLPGVPAGFVCPPTLICRAKEEKLALFDALRQLHSGYTFGKVGKYLSLASSCALLFFAVSGAWMYLRMWRDRRRRSAAPRWFW
ncbi:MAG: PepSY domain-containing protein [Novosphingobium sp.]